MQYKAILLPRTGDKAEQVFCADLEQAKKWARRILWDRCRKAVQTTGPGVNNTNYTGPWVHITEYKPVSITNVYPWDVTDADKTIEGGPAD